MEGGGRRAAHPSRCAMVPLAAIGIGIDIGFGMGGHGDGDGDGVVVEEEDHSLGVLQEDFVRTWMGWERIGMNE